MFAAMPSARHLLRRVRFRHRALRHPLVRARHRSLTPHDAFLASYPRSGTTWVRFLLYETLTGDASGFGLMRGAIPSLGKQAGGRPVLGAGGRLVQTHEPYCDRDRRVVYVVRDARAVVSSEFRWQQRSGYYSGSFERFVRDFAAGRSNPWGSWGEHVSYWRSSVAARAGHLHLVRYEDLRRETFATFTAILSFLGVDADDDVVRAAIANNTLDGMRAKEDRAAREGRRRAARPELRFIDKGSLTDWRDALAPAQVDLIEQHFGGVLRSLGYELSLVA
jgi:hypothetical protein